MSRLLAPIVAAGTAVVPLLLVVTPADALTCAAPYRYASTSNRIYATGVAGVTLTKIRQLCPSAPLQLVNAATKTWQLNADLQLERGSTLNLHGSEVGGDVDVLRLRSGSGGTVKDVASITAQYGTISINGVNVTSWDPATGAVDQTTSVPSGGDKRGRAFIRALSFLEGKTPRESRMDIVNSDIGYLGFYGAESYGVAYKARGCGVKAPNTPATCNILDVRGKQTGSRFHHNFMGTYTWGAYGMEFSRNKYDHNISYGLDPHDDSDHLRITNNEFSNNGNHGFICSERCDHLTITGNKSLNNGHRPYVPPGDDDPKDNQVHGIMLHRGVSASVVQRNVVAGQINGVGIAIFDSVGNTVSGNTVSGNKYGLRFSAGTRGTVVSGNRVSNSSLYAVFAYKGTDAPAYSNSNGRPSNITFANNIFNKSGSDIFKVQDADRFTFSGGSIAGSPLRGPRFERAQNHVYNSVRTPTGTTFTLLGTSGVRTSVTFKGIRAAAIKVAKDPYSTATFS